MTEQKEIRLGSYETNSWYYIPKQEKTFLKYVRQSQVDFFQSSAVVLPYFSLKLSLQEWRLLEIQTW